ncbi:tRNA-specific adenosine deaminase [Acrocarpospora pleiomorpha]|uniref:tRNA-specific adenosine deaminase n=1 Tax=Acrocarpospora pleiomorpha TaxID=90975 RepID=A0A5M3XXE2_9ACTN|nr:nucleoside deaminase [Acrocarpospora pleiomorpha]GES24083.1 tRNA-specific adenosine deaminase [Acrocarpospora pleiomorpha]
MSFSEIDLTHLRRCLELAAEAIDAGDEPFGSVLAAADGTALAEDRNRDNTGRDQTLHPEFQLARWAAAHLTDEERALATVYTSGEHCPMCSAAHAWVGLGRIVYVASSAQLVGWLAELGVGPAPVSALPIQKVAPGIRVEGPVPELTEEIHALHRRYHSL